MKAKERHQLKQNEFVETTQRVLGQLRANQDRALTFAGVAALVVVIGGGYWYWRKTQNDQAGALVGVAYGIREATIAPASTLPGATQQPGTFPTEQARDAAATKAFEDVVAKYPSSKAGLAATYEIAAMNLEAGKYSDAEAGFNTVISAGTQPWASTARLGLAETLLAEKKIDQALKMLTDLSADRDGTLPVDGVLAQLAQADLKAGKKDDARATYKRIVDEFADSQYAADAKQALTSLN